MWRTCESLQVGYSLFVHAVRFSKITKIFGCHHSLSILKTKSFEVTNPQNDFEFCFLENMFKRPVFLKQTDHSFTFGFSGPNSYWDCQETGQPRSQSLSFWSGREGGKQRDPENDAGNWHPVRKGAPVLSCFFYFYFYYYLETRPK